MKDYLVKAYAFDGTVRIYAARTTNLVNEGQKIHHTLPTATDAFGRVLTVSVIMGAMYKNDQELTIRIDGDGPMCPIITTANAKGQVRGFMKNPGVFLQKNDGSLHVGMAVGKGQIHVTKDLKVKDSFTSSATIQTGEIGEDFTYYFAASEQIPSAVGLGVIVNDDNSVLASGGFIIQVMPGCKEETKTEIEHTLTTMKPITKMIQQGMLPEEIIASITKGNHEFLEELELEYYCDCSKDKFLKGLITLGKEELTTLYKEDKQIETQCHFCNKKYLFTEQELKDIIENM